MLRICRFFGIGARAGVLRVTIAVTILCILGTAVPTVATFVVDKGVADVVTCAYAGKSPTNCLS